jgi:hypothetical protein
MSWSKATGDVTCDARRPPWPSIHRWLRLQFASLYRMNTEYMQVAGTREDPDCGLSLFVRVNESKRGKVCVHYRTNPAARTNDGAILEATAAGLVTRSWA